MSRNACVLVLGKAGFIGRNLYEFLVQHDSYLLSTPSHKELDVLDERAVFNELKHNSYDVVLNCLDTHRLADAVYAERRLRMFYNLVNHADLFGKMIYFGTGAEYGRQTDVKNVSETDLGRQIPLDSYGFAMFQMAQFTLQSTNIYDLRLFGIFGPYELWQRRFISNCICKVLYGFPVTVRQDRIIDYLYIDDLARIVLWALSSELEHHDYNVVSGRAYHLTELAEEIVRLGAGTERIFVAKPGYADEYTANNNRLRHEMNGFRPEPMQDSIAKLYRYYEANLKDIDAESLLYNEQ
jgi:GDP-L-fucose synthase